MAELMRMANAQAALWEVKRHVADLHQRAAQRPGRCVVDGVAYGPCLLVSRECGSGGGTVARQVGERLGWRVFDREIVDEVAQRTHVRQPLIESVDERVRSVWESLCAAVAHGPIGGDTYLFHLRQVLLSLGHHGDVVILGRGAQYVLPPPCALRVRLVAPAPVRAQRVAQREGLALEAARSRVAKVDTQRAAFIRASYQRDSQSPLNYDLTINTGELSLETAVEIVLDSLRGKLGVRPVK